MITMTVLWSDNIIQIRQRLVAVYRTPEEHKELKLLDSSYLKDITSDDDPKNQIYIAKYIILIEKFDT